MRSKGKFLAGVSRLAGKLAGDETGSPAVEFALVFPIFIAVVLATLQAASIFLVKAFFESAAEEAARVVLTNQTETLTAAQFQTEVCNQPFRLVCSFAQADALHAVCSSLVLRIFSLQG